MLSKDKRLNLKCDFNWMASGDKIENQFVKLFIRNADNLHPKIGIALSGQYFKKAVERNCARRLVASAFAKFYDDLKDNLNILVMPKSEVLNMTAQELVTKLKILLTAQKLIK